MLYLKLVWMYFIALFTATFIYPALHEFGHFLASVLVGAEVVEIAVFPVPYVSLFMDPFDLQGQAVIGMCGMLFPMICIIPQPKRFVSSIAVSAIMFANALAWLLSCVAITAGYMGFCWENEDVITVIRNVDGSEAWAFIFCLAGLIISLYVLFNRKNVSRILSFF